MRTKLQKCVSAIALPGIRLVLAALCVLFAFPASAQTVTTYVNPTDGNINGTTTCAAPLVRTFSVTTAFNVSDVDLGVYATHTWRGDIQITLISPTGTSVQLVNGDVNSTNGDNFNVRLNDGGTQVVNTDTITAAHSTAAPPPFANNFIPNSPLAAFNGEAAFGTWRMQICDLFPNADDGVFRHAELYLTSAPTNFADLSLTKIVSNPAPLVGTTISYTLALTNNAASTQTATAITVLDALPLGVNYSSHSGPGTYNPATGVWSISSLARGNTVSLTINAVVMATAGATVTNEAEVTASSRADSDSTPNNGVTSEDDYASASFTVGGVRTAGTPPVLTCPNGNVIFDWDTIAWTAGSTSNTYALGTLGNISFDLTNPGIWVNNATFGGQSPNRQNVFTGGIAPAQFSLGQLVDLPSRTDTAVTTITLPASMNGAQFTLFDVDFGPNQFADRVEVIGFNNGATVMPTLTNGIANYVIGNQAFGDAASDTPDPNGNVVVTFSAPVDVIEIRYGDHSLAPANPGLQGIAVHDINFCLPVTTLNVTKVSSVIADNFNSAANSKAIPGALVEYSFSVNNPNEVAVQNVTVTDFFPSDLKLCLSSLSGQGPVAHTGFPASGPTYNFVNLNNDTDDVDFTTDDPLGGGPFNWTYDPVLDGDSCDAAITGFRLTPNGSLNAGATVTFRARFILD